MNRFNSDAPIPALQAYEASKSMECIRLNDFGSDYLDDAGYLELQRWAYDTGPVLIDMKVALLELSRMAIDNSAMFSRPTLDAPSSAYILRNLTSGTGAAFIFDDQKQACGSATIETEQGTVTNTISMGSSYTIGRKTTPELDLPVGIEDEHLLLRFGSVNGRIHLADNYSRLGTDVYVNSSGSVGSPTLYYILEGFRLVRRAAFEGEWPYRKRDA